MKVKIESQEQYLKRIEYFKEKYTNDFQKKVSVPGCDKDYVRAMYKTEVLQIRKNDLLYSKNVREIHDYRNENKLRYGIDTFNAVRQFCKDGKLLKSFQEILESLAEYDAISQHFYSITDYKNNSEKPIAKSETLDEFISGAINKENLFCKPMPLKLPIEHFKILCDTKNKAGKAYLTESDFISFIKCAFLNDKSANKVTLNFGSREKWFVIKRFYEFYQKGIEFENSSQYKDKYIRLVSDNFTNWTYESLKNNFGNKVKRQW